MKRKVAPVVTLTLLLVSSLTLISLVEPVKSAPRTWTVDDNGPADFSKIQEAVNAANPGDTILVKNGAYNENVVVNKTVSLIGESKNTTIINGMNDGKNTLWVTASNVTVTGFTIQGSSKYGMYLAGTRSSLIYGNIIKNNYYGIFATWSSDNVIENNTVVDNTVGVQINDSTKYALRNNAMEGNKYNFGVWGRELSTFIHDIDTSNKVDGKPIYYLVNQQNKNIPADAGYVAVVNSTNVVVRNLTLTKNSEGILFAYSTRSKIQNVSVLGNAYGIQLAYSDENDVRYDTVTTNDNGVLLFYSKNNTINRDILLNNSYGIGLEQSDANVIAYNSIENGAFGISVSGGQNNTVKGNVLDNVKGGGNGITLASANTTVIENTVESSDLGLFTYDYPSSTYTIYHNNFINNTKQVELFNQPSIVWDNGYPSGGNYWSNFVGADLHNGPSQNVPGSDGIADTPLIIDANNIDHYPLMQPYRGPVRNLKTGKSSPTIQEAINGAGEGDRIYVFSGIYYENVVVNKTVSLVGESRENTIIDGNRTGTVVYVTASNVAVTEFTIRNSKLGVTSGSFSGLHVYNASGLNISHNTIVNNDCGIWLDSESNSSTVSGNDITNNKYGVHISSTSLNNVIYHNNFINNTIQAGLDGLSNGVSDNGFEGNYWSDYNGTDLNGDGVGDTNLPWQRFDYHPLMNRYWNPADINHDLRVDVKDIAAAARAFGSYPGNSLWNPHADITGPVYLEPDGKVDIRDIALVASNFGKIWAP